MLPKIGVGGPRAALDKPHASVWLGLIKAVYPSLQNTVTYVYKRRMLDPPK